MDKVNWKQVKRLLVIRFLGIGDVLFTTPMLHYLKQQNPHLHIIYLTSSYSAPVIQNNPDINEILLFDDFAINKVLRNPFKIFKLIFSLRQKGFDATIITHRSFFTIFFTYLIGTKIRIGFDYK